MNHYMNNILTLLMYIAKMNIIAELVKTAKIFLTYQNKTKMKETTK
jgi:hypothetical protein